MKNVWCLKKVLRLIRHHLYTEAFWCVKEQRGVMAVTQMRCQTDHEWSC